MYSSSMELINKSQNWLENVTISRIINLQTINVDIKKGL